MTERKDLEEKLLAGSSPDGECLRWRRAHDKNGYGKIWVDGRYQPVHRIAHQTWIGPIPDGLCIDHVYANGCRFHDCIRREHLEAVTWRENSLRGTGFLARCVAATHCPKGHPYDDENTYVGPNGWRRCRTCRRDLKRADRAKAREAK